jgi:hypothetical protein
MPAVRTLVCRERLQLQPLHAATAACNLSPFGVESMPLSRLTAGLTFLPEQPE